MKSSRGFSLLPIPLTLAAAAAGLALGIGGYAFYYAKGSSYMGNDPATCANCHVMAGHYAGWQAAPHHQVATCNDCHTPAGPVSKYVVKALNGWHHSLAFTLGGYPDVIRVRPESSARARSPSGPSAPPPCSSTSPSGSRRPGTPTSSSPR
jgi:cytochrome c nitrite reductase small subunit